MSSPQTAGQTSTAGDLKTLLTWRGDEGVNRLEQVRLNVNGARVKAYGRIIAAAHGDQEAFSCSYELVTNDAGVTKRLSIHLVRADGESQIGITRDEENKWLVRAGGEMIRSDFDGAEDVDVALSPMFNALPIRRHRLVGGTGSVEVPVLYVYLPSSRIEPATLTYTAGPDSITVDSPVANSALTVDENGFVIDYPGLATRV
ncbi:putative glycolipid-binding domain-containing protein [Gordonia sp. NB41Y]|uniref:putative glycolipid-binding domain-containing protein n=1 Tax=Gordonia sp. NB41Y TaxID=875808 RepID=UPI0002BE6344|nr:putative glycolipid-binding domain-containing protein [Gordonia sp. NB41Y]EMP12018.1 hypothetical protein ISGA_4726 [Gordonia sp. NB41Y]WLP92685.1 putative glycolipid-binding domain-containing protein [Gordonia sp. NB41Y]